MFVPIRSHLRIYVAITNSSFRWVACLLLAFISLAAYAQDSGKFNLGVGIGLDPFQNAGRNLNVGWNADIHGGVNMGQHADDDLDASHTEFGLTSKALAFFGATHGTIGVWNLTFQPRLHLAPRRRHRMNPYVTAGLGVFHRKLSLGRPALTEGIFCDPFFGCYPITQTASKM